MSDAENFAPSPTKCWRLWYVADGGRDGRHWALREEGSPGPIQTFDKIVLKETYGYTLRESERGYLLVEGTLTTVVQPAVGHVAIIGSFWNREHIMKQGTQTSIPGAVPPSQRCPECGRLDAKAGTLWDCVTCRGRFESGFRWWDPGPEDRSRK